MVKPTFIQAHANRISPAEGERLAQFVTRLRQIPGRKATVDEVLRLFLRRAEVADLDVLLQRDGVDPSVLPPL